MHQFVDHPYSMTTYQYPVPPGHPHCLLLLQVITVIRYHHTFSLYIFSCGLERLHHLCFEGIGFSSMSEGEDRLEGHDAWKNLWIWIGEMMKDELKKWIQK